MVRSQAVEPGQTTPIVFFVEAEAVTGFVAGTVTDATDSIIADVRRDLAEEFDLSAYPEEAAIALGAYDADRQEMGVVWLAESPEEACEDWLRHLLEGYPPDGVVVVGP